MIDELTNLTQSSNISPSKVAHQKLSLWEALNFVFVIDPQALLAILQRS